MHAAQIDRSARLQRVAAVLADGHWHSTLDILIGAGVCAVNSCVSELRANGLTIECRRVGRERFEYRLTGGIPRTVHASVHA
jgi:biotin operon repressor